MRGQGDRRSWPQLGRCVVPDLVEQLVHPSLPGGERRHQTALPLQTMGSVLVELGRWIAHERTVTGAEQVQLASAQARQTIYVARHRSRIRRDEDASLA